jgi:hypothetical protein
MGVVTIPPVPKVMSKVPGCAFEIIKSKQHEITNTAVAIEE